MRADASDRRFEPRDVPPQGGRTLGDLALGRACLQRRGEAAPGFDLLEQRPPLVAERSGQRLEGARARGRVGDKSEMGFAQENELAVARKATREAVGKADRERVRQDADAVGPAEPGRERRHRSAHHVHRRVARGHHAPRALGLDMRRPLLKPASLFDPGPQQPERAKFRQGDEFVRVCRESERDPLARLVKREAGRVEGAEEANRGAERKGELLGGSAARGMHASRVGDGERPGETPCSQCKRRADKGLT